MGVHPAHERPRPTHPQHQKYRWILFGIILTIYLFTQKLSSKPHISKPHTSISELPIPHRIWQTYFNYSPFPLLRESVSSWILTHQDYKYTLLSDEGANAFVSMHYNHRPKVRDTYLATSHHILRADLLRYMLLEISGGIYSDIDTTLLRPFPEWIPEHHVNDTRAVVGIEYDSLGSPHLEHGFPRPISFCQWTIAASAGHPMLTSAVETVVDKLQSTARAQNTTLASLKVDEQQVGAVTGPGIWTDVVFASLSKAVGRNVNSSDVTGLLKPRLFGDILILPINAFGTGQEHSGSVVDGAREALVRHQFKMSWREQWSN